jgi:hypothetical protein
VSQLLRVMRCMCACGHTSRVQHYNDQGLYYLHDIAGTYERSHEDNSGEYTIDPTYFGNVGAWPAVIMLCFRSSSLVYS